MRRHAHQPALYDAFFGGREAGTELAFQNHGAFAAGGQQLASGRRYLQLQDTPMNGVRATPDESGLFEVRHNHAYGLGSEQRYPGKIRAAVARVCSHHGQESELRSRYAKF